MKYLFLALLIFPIRAFTQSISTDIPTRIDSLLSKAEAYEISGSYQEMMDSASLALELCEKHFGPQSERYGDCLLVQGSVNMHLGHLAVADSLFATAKNIFVQTRGKLDEKYASCLYLETSIDIHSGEFQEGENTALETIALYEKLYGQKHLKYSESRELLGILYLLSGQHEKAEPHLLASKRIGGELTGRENADYAATLHFLSLLYTNMGRYDSAEPLLLEMQNIYKKTLGTQHLSYALSLDNIAQFYLQTGRYHQALRYFQESKTIVKKVLGTQHHHYATLLNNLGLINWELGNFEKSEQWYLQALPIFEANRGKETIDYASTLHNLGNLYTRMGRYEGGEKAMLEAAEILQKIGLEKHWKYPQALTNLANTYLHQKKYAEAKKYYLEAEILQKEIVGKDHQNYALTLHNLANLYIHTQQLEQADTLLKKVDRIYIHSIGNDTKRYAANLQAQAKVKIAAKDFAEAQRLLDQASKTQQRIFGLTNIDRSTSIQLLSKLYFLQGQYDTAAPYFEDYQTINQDLQIRQSSHLSNRELRIYQELFAQADPFFYSFLHRFPIPSITAKAYNSVLFQKGFLLENAIKRAALLAQAPDTIQAVHTEWKDYLRKLAKEYSKAQDERSSYVATLEKKANTLEKKLQQSVSGFENTQRPIRWQQVQKQLPPQSAAIEFIHFQDHQPEPSDTIFYGALLLRPEDKNPQWIPLCTQGQLQTLLQAPDDNQVDFLNQLYAPSDSSKTSLYSLIWQKLATELADTRTIYYAPSGLLHRIHLGAIAIDKTEKVADRFQLIQLGSTRQLGQKRSRLQRVDDAMLFGGIQYDSKKSSEQLITAPNTSEAYSPNTRSLSNFSVQNFKPPIDRWNPLNWTAVEVESIAGILADYDFQITLKNGNAATEEAFLKIGKQQSSPRILHLATHGYFFEDPRERQPFSSSKDTNIVFQNSTHPMIRSGLILAGANRVWQGGEAVPGKEDGILTAYEISQLDLSNTELVVLSACETGLGDIEGNEGVYGLQRAFKVAGAQYLIMSLWQVPDFQTQELMTTFYLEWLEEKKSIPEAFRAAQTQLRQRYPDPFQWAGFILVE